VQEVGEAVRLERLLAALAGLAQRLGQFAVFLHRLAELLRVRVDHEQAALGDQLDVAGVVGVLAAQFFLQVVEHQVGGGHAEEASAGILDGVDQRALQHLLAIYLIGEGLGDGVAAALFRGVVEVAPARLLVVGLVACQVILVLGEVLHPVGRHHHVDGGLAVLAARHVRGVAAGRVLLGPVEAVGIVVAVEGVRLPQHPQAGDARRVVEQAEDLLVDHRPFGAAGGLHRQHRLRQMARQQQGVVELVLHLTRIAVGLLLRQLVAGLLGAAVAHLDDQADHHREADEHRRRGDQHDPGTQISPVTRLLHEFPLAV